MTTRAISLRVATAAEVANSAPTSRSWRYLHNADPQDGCNRYPTQQSTSTTSRHLRNSHRAPRWPSFSAGATNPHDSSKYRLGTARAETGDWAAAVVVRSSKFRKRIGILPRGRSQRPFVAETTLFEDDQSIGRMSLTGNSDDDDPGLHPGDGAMAVVVAAEAEKGGVVGAEW